MSLGCCFFQKWKNGLGKAKASYILCTPWAPGPSHLLGASPAPVKFLQSQTSISWQPGIVFLWRNTVVMGNCDHGEKQVLWGIRRLACLYCEGTQQPCTPLKTRAELGCGAVSTWKACAAGLYHITPLHSLRSSRTPQAGVLLHASLCSLAPFLRHVIFLLKCQ